VIDGAARSACLAVRVGAWGSAGFAAGLGGELLVDWAVLSTGASGVRARDGRGGSACPEVAPDVVFAADFAALWLAPSSGVKGRSGSATIRAVETTPAPNAAASRAIRQPRPVRRRERE